MMKKIIMIICDGMGDLPIKEFGNKTPLEAANTPNMDKLAKEGINGQMHVLGKGVRPNSDEAHLTLFGYNLKTDYPGRGPIEAAGIGINLKHGDVAIRANVATVDDKLRVIDRRAGRVDTTAGFVKDLDGMKIKGITFIVKPGTGHRVGLVMRGKGLSDKITNSDVHYVTEEKIVEHWENLPVNKIKPLDNSKEAKFTAEVLQEFLEKAHEILEKNPLNKKREMKANYLLTRGPGYYKQLKSFKEMYNFKSACIAGAGLYKGLGTMAGMDLIKVKGATGMTNTNVKAKFEKAKEVLKNHNFIFVHVKPTDVYGENGDCKGKKDFIEKIDKAIKVLMNVDAMIVITADHSTPCSHKDHSADPVPVLVHYKGIKPDSVMHFSERECAKGSLGVFDGKDFMKKMIKIAKE